MLQTAGMQLVVLAVLMWRSAFSWHRHWLCSRFVIGQLGRIGFDSGAGEAIPDLDVDRGPGALAGVVLVSREDGILGSWRTIGRANRAGSEGRSMLIPWGTWWVCQKEYEQR
jgi:hypothetical protein